MIQKDVLRQKKELVFKLVSFMYLHNFNIQNELTKIFSEYKINSLFQISIPKQKKLIKKYAENTI